MATVNVKGLIMKNRVLK